MTDDIINFFSIQNGCQSMCPIIYSLTNLDTHGLGNTCVKFPLDLCSRSGEDFFMGFRVNPIWLPNHVTYEIMCEPFVPHG